MVMGNKALTHRCRACPSDLFLGELQLHQPAAHVRSSCSAHIFLDTT